MLTNKTVLKLNKFLCQRARKVAEKQGYSSFEEFVEHAIEKELAHLEQPAANENVAAKLKGLGYIE